MNKTAIKNFAVWARNKLIADISYRAGLIGITESGIASALPQSTGTTEFYDIGTAEPYAISGDEVRQRRRLVELIMRKEEETDYKTAYNYIIEEVAYTWFNRLIAIRFMEVNDYLPSHIRVLSSETGKMEPDLVTSPFDADFEFSCDEEALIVRLKQENQLDELFKMLFIKQCNALNDVLPELFEKTSDYTELLLNLSFIDREGVVYHLLNDIDEEDFNVDKEGQVEIIGWLYQFYNIEPKANVFSKKEKISKEEVPAATQLFTPDWIVRYMVENSLGRLWIDGHLDEQVKNKWTYYIEEADQQEDVQLQMEPIRENARFLKPEDIKIIDPCMGSGHILVYCFDILMQIYESQGYTQKDAAKSILENNLFGLDIDKRAVQLSYFAVMMKARYYDRRILNRGITPHILVIEESNTVNRNQLKFFGTSLAEKERNHAAKDIVALLDDFKDAKEYGSILKSKIYDWKLLRKYVENLDAYGQIDFDRVGIDNTQILLLKLISQGEILARKYQVVVTNPPYMMVTAGSAKLIKYVKENYPNSKTDLFAVFIERCYEMTETGCYQAMITMHAWMFLSSYEKLREKINAIDTINMVHLGARAFEEIGGEVVQTTSFVFRKSCIKNYIGTYYRLTEPNTQQGKEGMFLRGENKYYSKRENFLRIPGMPVAYWISPQLLKAFISAPSLSTLSEPKVGLQSGNSEKYYRLWHEVCFGDISFNGNRNYKWFPCVKGGEARKWYGNNHAIIDWSDDGKSIKNESSAVIRNPGYYFKPGITWTKITSTFALRYFPENMILSDSSVYIFPQEKEYILGLLNSKVAPLIVGLLNPTLNFVASTVGAIPVIKAENDRITELVEQNIKIAKNDWDSYETSWDFSTHPLVRIAEGLWDVTATGASMHYYYGKHIDVNCPLELCFMLWQGERNEYFKQLKENEEELNRIFIGIYGMEEEIIPDVLDKDVTVHKADLQLDIKSLISYAVGCMFGRYSLNYKGLSFAGGKWDDTRYSSFIPDIDNSIPVMDEEYFEDDIVGRFVKFIEVVFGKDSLEDNLDFIAKNLGNRGNTNRDVIRNYFLNDFIKDHLKTYQKRPVYWMFDSGKQNGFKSLVYMHRWNADTIGNVRIDYLHKTQRIYESEINRMQDMIDHSTNSREVATATKRKEKLQKQLKECREYDEKIGHLALSRIDIDLDDGVKVNYEKVQTASDGKKYQVLAKI